MRSRVPETERAAPAVPAPPAALQRSVSNAALARVLARQPTPNLFDPRGLEAAVADHGAAVEAVAGWFDRLVGPDTIALSGSVAELVQEARAQPFTLRDGRQGKVSDQMSAGEAEEQIRRLARQKNVRLQEHRDASDVAGVRKELSAVLANLGAIPTQITFGGDEAKITASISGKVTAQAGDKRVKVQGEVSPEGGSGSVTVPGAKFGLEGSRKGLKASVKIGELVSVSGAVQSQADGVIGWKADISIGTIGKLLMPEDVAKVFVKAEETFSKSAGELARNLDDPAKVKEHGAALEGAVSEAIEKAKKSASQKPGWRVGAEFKGDSAGGFSGSATLTWVFD